MPETVAFYTFAGLAVGASALVIGQRNPMYSVLLLIASFGALSGLYIQLDAPFVAVAQIIIYAGAIMVLFLFVVMLLNVPREDAAEWYRSHPLYRPGAVRVGAVLALLMVIDLGWSFTSIADVGRVLFTDYMFAFEVTSILIIVAMVGAVILARKRDQ